MASTADYKVGDVLKFTYRYKGPNQGSPDRTRQCVGVVRGIGDELNKPGFAPGTVAFCQYDGRAIDVTGLGDNGQGCFYPQKVGTKQYGLVNVQVLGHDPAAVAGCPVWQPKPGNTGYDPMC